MLPKKFVQLTREFEFLKRIAERAERMRRRRQARANTDGMPHDRSPSVATKVESGVDQGGPD